MKANKQKLACYAEWHLRDHPRALAIYSFALALTRDGRCTFTMSRSHVAEFFGWDIKTVKSAFEALVNSGWFAPTAKGYRVLTHAELRQAGCICWAGEDESDGE